MINALDFWWHLLALWTPPPLMPFVRNGHRVARQTVGFPTEPRRSAEVIPFPARR